MDSKGAQKQQARKLMMLNEPIHRIIPKMAVPVIVFAADPPATSCTPIGLRVFQILSPVSISTCCMLPFGRWNSLRNESSGRTANMSVRAFPMPKIDAINILLQQNQQS